MSLQSDCLLSSPSNQRCKHISACRTAAESAPAAALVPFSQKDICCSSWRKSSCSNKGAAAAVSTSCCLLLQDLSASPSWPSNICSNGTVPHEQVSSGSLWSGNGSEESEQAASLLGCMVYPASCIPLRFFPVVWDCRMFGNSSSQCPFRITFTAIVAASPKCSHSRSAGSCQMMLRQVSPLCLAPQQINSEGLDCIHVT